MYAYFIHKHDQKVVEWLFIQVRVCLLYTVQKLVQFE